MPGSSRKLLYTVDMLDRLPPPRWLVDDLIPEQGLAVLFGPSGVGKSFFTLDLAMRVAQERAVVYVAAEGAGGYSHRVEAWRRVHGDGGQRLIFDFDALPLLHPVQVESFIQRVQPARPALVILDTLARCMVGGNESSAKSMGEVIQACARLQNELGAAVLLVHHTGKDGQTERGSSALRGAADTMLRLTADGGIVCLSSSKSKDGAPFPDRLFELQPVAWDNATSCVLMPFAGGLPETFDDDLDDDTIQISCPCCDDNEWPNPPLLDRWAR